jgi:hypothetical protein
MASELGELRRGLGGSIRLIISIGDGGDDLEECRKVNPSAPFIGRPVATTCGLPETATVSAVAWRLPRSPRSTAARQLLRVVDLTQVQHVSLHHAPPGDPRVLDNAPIAVLLAILPANLAAQEHGRRLSAHWRPWE